MPRKIASVSERKTSNANHRRNLAERNLRESLEAQRETIIEARTPGSNGAWQRPSG